MLPCFRRSSTGKQPMRWRRVELLARRLPGPASVTAFVIWALGGPLRRPFMSTDILPHLRYDST
jgi:hypothetical protein